jgi:cytochrome c
MTRSSGRLALLFAVVFAGVSIARLDTQAQRPQWTPAPPTNLQVLPKDIPLKQLIQTMRAFTQGLGVRCQHCHVYKGSDPDDLTTFDFASDDKESKKTARAMIRMATAINTDYLKDIGEARPAGELKVTCYTCHRGETKPATIRPETK